jgi:hypothetical protein
MDELVSVLLSVQDRIEGVIKQIDCGALSVVPAGPGGAPGAADAARNFLELLRAQRDDLDKAIALARNPQRKAY